ncbi:Uncharacterised protein [Anaerococcus octavius]|jgi:hypothetical protein|uniref:Aminoglycoside phosphotransferase domain-containing protein n=1 Tax=Anaerococcus octavius TaxID=54007 RepID=A0A380WT73_9FIRM|nr:phosphotransferase [Anaerococcus octavius]SUU92221.1 Uncharacterised protein [Anaerococcus octavius]
MPVYIKNQIKNINYFKNNGIKIKEINFINHDRYRVMTENQKFVVNLYDNDTYPKIETLGLNKEDILEKGQLDQNNIYQVSKLNKITNLYDYLKNHSKKDNYDLGFKFGKILKKVHGIPIDEKVNWFEIFNTRANYLFYMHGVNEYIGDDDYILIDYINANKHLTKNVNQRYIFNKLNYENILIDENGKISIFGLDFNKVGDRVYDFARINYFALESEEFVKGCFDSYFKETKVPVKFYRLLALYAAYNILYDIVEYRDSDKCAYNKEEIDDLLKIYDDFNTFIPTWL